jgi:hypothetical protein
MRYLGLDLGTGLAKLAQYPSGEPARAGQEIGVTTVAAAVSYRRHAGEIPAGYPDQPQPGVVRCDGFPALLGTRLSAVPVPVWQGRTPGEVTQSFLRCLLDPPGTGTTQDTGSGAGTETVGDEDDTESADLVITVPPHAGTRPGPDDEPSTEADLQDILSALGRPARRVVAAPVAALLWLRQRDPDLAAAGRIVVVDVGAGSIELSLCTATGTAVRVVDSICLAGGPAWGTGGLAAAAGGRSPALAEYLVTALAAASGVRVDPGGQESVSLWRAFERAIADDRARDRLDVVLQSAAAARHRHGSAPALRFGGLEVTASQVLDACEPLARQSVAALGQLLGRHDDPGWLRFGPGGGARLVLLGGLSTLHPVRAALLASLGLDPERPGPGVIRPADDDLLGAVARGAALLAAGLADPGDRYPHALRLAVSRVVRDRLVSEHLELAAPGSIDLELGQTLYLTNGTGPGEGSHVLVTIRPAASSPPGSAPIPVQIVPSGRDPVPAAFRWAAPPEPGVYRVGVRGGPDGPAVVLQRADGGKPLTYPLAETADLDASHVPGQAIP